jgi:hypothetical protein
MANVRSSCGSANMSKMVKEKSTKAVPDFSTSRHRRELGSLESSIQIKLAFYNPVEYF